MFRAISGLCHPHHNLAFKWNIPIWEFSNFNYILNKLKCFQTGKNSTGKWFIFCKKKCPASTFRIFGVPLAVIWKVTCWQRAVLHQLWSLQAANCRWWRTGPSATRQQGPRKTSLRSSPRNYTSPSGQVGFTLRVYGLVERVFSRLG